MLNLVNARGILHRSCIPALLLTYHTSRLICALTAVLGLEDVVNRSSKLLAQEVGP